ncbi:MAG: SEC-C domain-containing protein [Pseudonocardia sp.]|nr:SEC-C domain-containing protein [Pseudonocardia sp.]
MGRGVLLTQLGELLQMADDLDGAIAAYRDLVDSDEPAWIDGQARLTDSGVVNWVVEALEACSDLTEAARWCISYIERTIRRTGAGDSRFAMVVVTRRRIRRAAGPPGDRLDALLDDQVLDEPALPNGEDVTPVLFMTRDEFEGDPQSPLVEAAWQGTWDDHRAGMEEVLREKTRGLDPALKSTQLRYARHLVDQVGGVAWPPGRNESCWCSSTVKYKKCCGRAVTISLA